MNCSNLYCPYKLEQFTSVSRLRIIPLPILSSALTAETVKCSLWRVSASLIKN